MLKDLTGQRFGKLLVVKRTEDYIFPSGKHAVQYLCQCDCGNSIVTKGYSLLHKNKQSCGCVQILYHHRNNVYDTTGEYRIGYTTNSNKKFYFDLDDYDLIKNYCWWETTNGYIVSKNIALHRIIMSAGKDEIIDHINHNKLDNRKCNLRKCTRGQNNINIGKRINNTSGYTGVFYKKDRQKWGARININGEKHSLGCYINKEDAIKARKQAEEMYFGEWSYHNSINKNNDVN